MSSASQKQKTDYLDLVAECLEKALNLSGVPRALYFEELGRQDATLRADVMSLVEAHENSGTFLAKPIGPQLLKQFSPDDGLPDFQGGEIVGDFQILRLLGQGGLARVYLARQLSLGREVALKVSRSSGNEARLMAPLEHDHIVKVFSDTVDGKNLRFMCMQYVPGTTLEKILHELAGFPTEKLSGAAFLEVVDRFVPEDLPFHPSSLQFRDMLAKQDFFEAVLWVGARLADTLEYAHQRGVLHLDVKPANILLNPYGRFMLSDFNVSLSLEDLASGPAQIGGTRNYMAPEQEEVFLTRDRSAAVAKLDRRTDLYSLCLVLRECLAIGGNPGVGEPPWRSVLDKCLNRDPDLRFPDGASLAKALRGALERYRIEKELPAQNWFTQFSFRHPILGLVVYGLIPQLMASVVNILYNQLEIVSRLSANQQAYFRSLMLYYNPVVYAVCLGMWVWALKGIIPYLKRPMLTIPEQTSLRKRVLRLPLFVSLVTTIGWVPSSVLFPLLIHMSSEPLPLSVFGHFMISFFFSWLVALGYSSLFIQFICVRVFYPRLWRLEADIQVTASRELGIVAQTTRLYNRITSYVPLLGALLLHGFACATGDYSGGRVLSALSCLLIAFGVVGNYLGSRRNNQLIQTLFAFMGRAALAERRRSPRVPQ